MTPFDRASLSLSGAELPPPTVGGSPLISGGHVASSSGDKLEQGAKVSSKSKSLWIKQPYQRQTDPLLRYLWQARNADEHTLQQINQLQPASAKVVEPKQEDAAALERARAHLLDPDGRMVSLPAPSPGTGSTDADAHHAE